jgi:DNA-directed RNA polymerase specialized sigma24 family protein
MDDHARFERLYQGHAGAVLTFARRRTSPNEAEDVVAEVFLVAWEQLNRRQVAQVLGTSAGTVAVRLHRARGCLARALDARPARSHEPAELEEVVR